MAEYEQHLQAATTFFREFAEKFGVKLDDVSGIYENFELIHESFVQFGFPEFKTYKEVHETFCSLGATDLEFTDPASLFNNFVNLIVLDGDYEGENGPRGFDIFTSYPKEYTVETLELCLRKCFPQVRIEKSVALLDSYMPYFGNIFMPVFGQSDQIQILYELCFLYWFICHNGPMTRQKTVTELSNALVLEYARLCKNLDEGYNQLNDFNLRLATEGAGVVGVDRETCYNQFVSNTSVFSNTQFIKLSTECFRNHAAAQWMEFELSALAVENLEQLALVDRVFEIAREFLIKKQQFCDVTMQQLVCNVFAGNLIEEFEHLIASSQPKLNELDSRRSITPDDILNYLQTNILARIKQNHIGTFVQTTSEILRDKSGESPALPVLTVFEHEKLMNDVESIFSRFLEEETVAADADFYKQLLNFYEAFLLDLIAEPVSKEVKRDTALAFLQNVGEFSIYIAAMSDTDEIAYNTKIGELEEICEAQADDSVTEDVAYLIQYKNRAGLVHDVLIRQFLQFMALLCEHGRDYDIETFRKDVEAVVFGTFEWHEHSRSAATVLSQFGDDFAQDCFGGRRVQELAMFSGLEYDTKHINTEFSILEELEDRLLAEATCAPDNHLSLGFLSILRDANIALAEQFAQKQQFFAETRVFQVKAFAHIKELIEAIIRMLEVAEKSFAEIETMFTEDPSKSELTEAEQALKRLIQELDHESVLAASYVELFTHVFYKYLAEGFFAPQAYLFCFWMAMQLKSEWDRIYQKVVDRTEVLEGALSLVEDLERMGPELESVKDDVERFCEFSKSLSDDSANEDTFKECCKEYAKIGGVEAFSEMIRSFVDASVSRYAFIRQIVNDITSVFLSVCDGLDIAVQRFEQATERFPALDLVLLAHETDIELLEDKIMRFNHEFTDIVSTSGATVAQQSFSLISLSNEIEACEKALAGCVCDTRLDLTRFQLDDMGQAALKTVDSKTLEPIFEELRCQIEEKTKREAKLRLLREKYAELLERVQQSRESAQRSFLRELEGVGNDCKVDECFDTLEQLVGRFHDSERCICSYAPSEYLVDCMNLYMQQCQVFCGLELDGVQELSKSQRRMFEEIRDVLGSFVQQVHAISEVGVAIKLKKLHSGDDMLIIKQIVQYLPFLQEMCEILRVLSTKAQVDEQIKVLFQEYNIQFSSIFVPQRPQNFDLLQKTQSNLNEIKMFGSIQIGELSGVVQEYLAEDVVLEFERQKSASAIEEELLEDCRKVVVSDYAVFGLSELVMRAARKEEQFTVYYENICDFCAKEFPQIIAQLVPLQMNDEIQQLQARTLHLRQKALRFDQNCRDAIEQLLRGETKIQIASAESYDRRLEYSLVCGCVGYPRELILCFEALLEGKKHVNERCEREDELKRQKTKAKDAATSTAHARIEKFNADFKILREYPALDVSERRKLQEMLTAVASELYVIVENYHCDENGDTGEILHKDAELFEEMCYSMEMQSDNAARDVRTQGEQTLGQSYALLGEALRELIESVILNFNSIETPLPMCNIANNVQYTALYQRFFETAKEMVKDATERTQEQDAHLQHTVESVQEFLEQAFERYAESSSRVISAIIEAIISQKEYSDIFEQEKEYIRQQTELIEAVDYQLYRLMDLENSKLLARPETFESFSYVLANFLTIECASKALRAIITAFVEQESDLYELCSTPQLLEWILEHHKNRMQEPDTDIKAAKQVLSRVLSNLRSFVNVTLDSMEQKMECQAGTFTSSCSKIYEFYEQEFGINIQIMQTEGEFAGNYIVDMQEFARLLSGFELLMETPEPSQPSFSASTTSGAFFESAVVKAMFVTNIFEKSKVSTFKLPLLAEYEFPFRFSGKCYCHQLKFLLDNCAKWTLHFNSAFCDEFLESQQIYAGLLESQRKLNGNEIVNKRLVEELENQWVNCDIASIECVREFKQELVQFTERNSRLSLPCFKQQYIDQLYAYVRALFQLARKVEHALIALENDSNFKVVAALKQKALVLQQNAVVTWCSGEDPTALMHEVAKFEVACLQEMQDDFASFVPLLKQAVGAALQAAFEKTDVQFTLPPEPSNVVYKSGYKSTLTNLNRILKKIEPKSEILYTVALQAMRKLAADENVYCIVGGDTSSREKSVSAFIETYEQLYRLGNSVEKHKDADQQDKQQVAKFKEDLAKFAGKYQSFVSKAIQETLLLRCCQCFSGFVDEEDEDNLKELELVLGEFPALKEEMTLLFEQLAGLKSKFAVQPSFVAALDSEMLVGIGRAGCEVFESEATSRKLECQNMDYLFADRPEYAKALELVTKMAAELLEVSLTYLLKDGLSNSEFDQNVFSPGFLISTEEPVNFGVIHLFKSAIKYTVKAYSAETRLRVRSKYDAPLKKDIEFSGRFIVQYIGELVDKAEQAVNKLHGAMFGKILLQNVRSIVFTRRLCGFILQIIGALGMQRTVGAGVPHEKSAFCDDLLAELEPPERESIARQLESAVQRLQRICFVLQDYEDFTMQINQLALRTNDELMQIGYFSTALDALTCYCVAAGQFSRDEFLAQIEEEVKLQDGMFWTTSFEDHYYLLVAARALSGFIDTLAGLQVVDAFEEPLFPIVVDPVRPNTIGNALFLSQNAFSGCIGAMTREGTTGVVTLAQETCSFLQKAEFVHKMREECVQIELQHEQAVRQLKAELQHQNEAYIQQFVQELQNALFDELFHHIDANFHLTIEDPQNMLNTLAAQDCMAHLYVVCGGCERLKELDTDVRRVLLEIQERMNSIELLKSQTRSQTAISAYLALDELKNTQ